MPAQTPPSTSVAKDANARRLIYSRVGGGAFERFGTTSAPDDMVRGAPQPMHAVALLLTARLEFDHDAGTEDYFTRTQVRVPNAAFAGAAVGACHGAVIAVEARG